MASSENSSYDELPYGDRYFPYTHPDHLATIGRLMGVECPTVETCRVLELGCAGGSNVIAMAQELSGAQFIGIDLSPRQVEAGQAMIARLGLTNVELKAMSILDFDETFGAFDYIICHGVFSWVPEPVRLKILAIIGETLKPNGVAYVSYNTYPGWHARGIVRDMMTFHVRGTSSAMERVEKARGFLEELVRVIPEQTGSYSQIIKFEADFLRDSENSYFYHEHLEDTNHPIYFREMAELVSAQGLRYLAEARNPGRLETIPPHAQEVIAQWSEDEVAREQYLDFLTNQTFRRSLFCRAELEGIGKLSSGAVPTLFVSSNVAPLSDGNPLDLATDAPVEFRKSDGGTVLTTNNPIVKAALQVLHLNRHHSLPFETLLEQAAATLGRPASSEDQEGLAQSCFRCFLSNLVDLHVLPPRFTVEVSEKPLASPLARIQAETTGAVFSLRRRTVELADFERMVLQLLDGEHDEAAISETLVSRIQSGEFSLYQGTEPVTDAEIIRAMLASELPSTLTRLSEGALLMA